MSKFIENAKSIQFTKESIKYMEQKVLQRKEGIGLEANYVENEFEKKIRSI